MVGVLGERGPLDVGELAKELSSSSHCPKCEKPVETKERKGTQ